MDAHFHNQEKELSTVNSHLSPYTDWKIGDDCEIYSVSLDTWTHGKIVAKDGSVLTVNYGDHTDIRTNRVDTNSRRIRVIPPSKKGVGLSMYSKALYHKQLKREILSHITQMENDNPEDEEIVDIALEILIAKKDDVYRALQILLSNTKAETLKKSDLENKKLESQIQELEKNLLKITDENNTCVPENAELKKHVSEEDIVDTAVQLINSKNYDNREDEIIVYTALKILISNQKATKLNKSYLKNKKLKSKMEELKNLLDEKKHKATTDENKTIKKQKEPSKWIKYLFPKYLQKN
jgi:hypothetical protein